ncbi:TetR/AcrR family transcriptional regulator [Nocardioides sp. NPDC057772]|uniref:TetR/AcrR family transcriptional regulator n=1 Tax=Nocardioides sp. NPDC057772 TaxID=3346245 RepID=UPI0036703F64
MAPREQILDAAARLFTGSGFAATSTREIADEVGIRQASLYYHFAGKDEILGELLEKTVRPTLDSLDDLAQVAGPEARLYTLAYRDAQVLAELPHNIGALPTHPDVTSTDVCDEYQAARQQLRRAYGALAAACASDAVNGSISQRQLGELIIQQVEGVVRTRAADNDVTPMELHAVAATCLRICGVPEDRAKEATRTCVL